ncbi:MAG: hypothetical protein AB7G17_10750 [Phycisphaerales bacterium]
MRASSTAAAVPAWSSASRRAAGPTAARRATSWSGHASLGVFDDVACGLLGEGAVLSFVEEEISDDGVELVADLFCGLLFEMLGHSDAFDFASELHFDEVDAAQV